MKRHDRCTPIGGSTQQRSRQLRLEMLENRLVLSVTGWLREFSSAVSSGDDAPIDLTVPVALSTPLQSTSPAPQWIRALDFREFGMLTAETIHHLSEQQVASIPTDFWFATISNEARAHLTVKQVRALDVAAVGLKRLTVQQVNYLSTEQIQSIDFNDFKYLTANESVRLTPAQVGTIPSTGILNSMSASTRAALTATQVQSLNVSAVGLSKLTSAQIGYLLPAQIQSIDFREMKHLGPAEIVHLLPAQVASIPSMEWFKGIPASSRAGLTTAQVQALPVGLVGLSTLTSEQVSWLTPQQVQTIDYTQFQFLGPEQIVHLSPDQLATIPSIGWFNGIPTASRAALTASQIVALDVATIGLSKLTSVQVGYLTPAQVQAVDYTQFQYLGAEEIVHLLPSQVATIPSIGWFNGIPSATRAALNSAQVAALDVAAVGLSRLTADQVRYLLPHQVRSIDYTQFQFLGPEQVEHLLPSQVADIPTIQWFNGIPTATRAAFTASQVQALDIAAVGTTKLTGLQRSFLLPSQIASMTFPEFVYLLPSQVPYLTLEQVASIPSVAIVRQMSHESQAALTRPQLHSLQSIVRAEFNRVPVQIADPSDFANPLTIPPAPDGLAGDQRTLNEAKAILALVPYESMTHVSAASGNWSDPATWQGGEVPGQDADVLVAAGHTVTFDENMSRAIRTLRIDGLLTFATNKHTEMLVDTIVVDTTGALHVGTEQQPIDEAYSARFLFSAGPIDTQWDPQLISRGISGRGQIRVFGREVTPFVDAGVAPSAGTTQLVLTQDPQNWQVGDQLIVPGVTSYGSQDEQRQIQAIDGKVVTIAPLLHNHVPPSDLDVTIQIANITRNVTFESAHPETIAERGHLMFAHNPDVKLVNAGLYGLGRTDKTKPVNDPVVVDGVLQAGTGLNRRARYPVHFHRTGVDPEIPPAIVRGNAVVGSPGWGLVNHSSHVIMEDNVALDVVGAAFTTEDGNEIGAFRRNLAIRGTGSAESIIARSTIHDFGHGGHGFWLQGPGVEVVDNIAVGQAQAAFVFFTASSQNLFNSENLTDPALAAGNELISVGSVPLSEVAGNVAYGSSRALEMWFHMMNMPDGQSTIEDFLAWNIETTGVHLFYTGQTTLRNVTLIGNISNPTGIGIASNDASHDVTYDNVKIRGFEVGIDAPVRRTSTVVGGRFATVQAIRVPNATESTRALHIVVPPVFEALPSGQLKGRKQFAIFLAGEADVPVGDLGTFFSSNLARLGRVTIRGQQLYHPEQAREFIPFRSDSAPTYAPDVLVNQTNQELWDQFGIAVGGFLAPLNAVPLAGTNALIGDVTEPPLPLLHVSPRFVSELNGYRLEYLNPFGDVIKDFAPTDLQEGWNLFTRQVDGQQHTFFVYGDTKAPTFSINSKFPPAINPNGLSNGFVLHGFVLDESFNLLLFRKEFNNLASRPLVIELSGRQFIPLDFVIGDLAGNLKTVRVELVLDSREPILPRPVAPYVKPPTDTKASLLAYYYLTGQTELIPYLTD